MAAPAYDPIAGALVAAAVRADPDAQDDLLGWVCRYGRCISDDRTRLQVHGAVGVALADHHLPRATTPRAIEAREALAGWAKDPTDDLRRTVRAASARLSRAQHDHQTGDSWYAHRGLLAACRVASPAPHDVRGVLEAVTWDEVTRDLGYLEMRRAREELDGLDGLSALVSPGAPVAAWIAGERQRTARALETLANDLDMIKIGPQHSTLIRSALHAYETANHRQEGVKHDSGSGRPAHACARG